jgi:hypothetical protein
MTANVGENPKLDDKYNNAIETGLICPYCRSKTQLVDSSIVYGKSYGLIYLCQPCNAYVGVHKGTTNAKGRLANEELRYWKIQAHSYFDKIARTPLIHLICKEELPKLNSRNKAYWWLAKQMNMDQVHCHIGKFDVDECKRVIEICKRYVGSML